MKYDYAKLSAAELEEINKLQARLSGEDKQVVLLAVEKKFEIAQLAPGELEKIAGGREIVLVALSR